jgi:radical SAM protein with 4Fe4S-binding SPASM domain
MPSCDFYPVLSQGYVLRKLEAPFVYDTTRDELYELDVDAFEFLKKCDGKNLLSKLLPYMEVDGEILDYMLDEGILQKQQISRARKINVEQSPVPSLRYLLLNITNKCNISCKHCYLGKSGNRNITPAQFKTAISQFQEMGGLKLMVTGGEPLMHPDFWNLMESLDSFELRIILLSNGTMIGKKEARKLSDIVDEVQISIDGIRSHDILRGKGAYEKSMSGLLALKESGVPVSIATMVHRFNIQEFEEMQKLFSELEVLSWSVDVPCVVGNLKDNPEFALSLQEASAYLEYGFGAGAHESTGCFTCGSHICSVSTDGKISKCGFFEDEPVGDVHDLKAAWTELCKKYLWNIKELDCKNCKNIMECRGGCRFRAKQYKGILASDPLLCYANGVTAYL